MTAVPQLLRHRFGPEWDALTREHRAAVLADFGLFLRDGYFRVLLRDAGGDGSATDASREYRRRVGGGNLAAHARHLSYARCLSV